MQPSAKESYLVTEVMTATPQKLQLMLVEAAIRSAERARKKWRDDEDEQAGEALIHAQQIIGELIGALDQEAESHVVKRVASVYLFVFRNLMEASLRRDQNKLDDALQVLQIERETWRRVCEKLGSVKGPAGKLPPPKQLEPSGPTAAQVPLPDALPPATGISLEA